MLLKFKSTYDQYNAGDTGEIEVTLARRLIGLGKAELYDPEKIIAEAAEKAAKEKAKWDLEKKAAKPSRKKGSKK